MAKKRQLAVLIPAYNEAVILERTLRAILELICPEDIYVIDDGSSDKTAQVAAKYLPGSRILVLSRNLGKARATNLAIRKFKLARRYRFLMPMDADTIITADFIPETLKVLEGDRQQKLACVVGKVLGKNHSWITSYRLWEYEISQAVYKKAQEKIGSIIVCPGCATVYRAQIFARVRIPAETITEDMDFTFEIHRRNLGRIAYAEKAQVVTQDPGNLTDFVKQADRWYTGFWQCVAKHQIPWGGQRLDLEVALLASEGLLNSFLVLFLLFVGPWILLKNPALLVVPFLADLFLFLIPTLFYTAWKNGTWKIFYFIPQFYLIRALSSLLYLKSFLKVVLGGDFLMRWHKAVRYQEKEAKIWPSPSSA
ncbi:MAG TPA: glycosyltransferase family 2 protein [Candidatus Bathyarchaeia archaeon]|nr:glycosyltransferase family 2 protein [Candidatus Bathyarchaeia archaeon]